MTNEKAISILKYHMEMCRFNPMTGEEKPMNQECEELANACDVAITSLENEDKYRWHDLRKNPDDLPEEGHEVLILVNNACFLSRRSDYNYWSCLGRVKVKAWREIEPFEVEE